MKVQNHVNSPEGSWPRGKTVSIRDGQVHCELAMDRAYDLVESYGRDPHLAFLRLKTERDLVFFIQTWGPLYRTYAEGTSGVTVLPVKTYWTFQRWLKAVVNLLGAVKERSAERKSLQDLLDAELEMWESSSLYRPGGVPSLHYWLKVYLQLTGDLSNWIQQANLHSVRIAVSFALKNSVNVRGTSLLARWPAGQPQIVARWNVDDLKEALVWMVWHDEWSQHPLLFCQACREAYRPKTAHRTKYCTPECAHRVAARNWRRRDSLRKKRKRRRK